MSINVNAEVQLKETVTISLERYAQMEQEISSLKKANSILREENSQKTIYKEVWHPTSEYLMNAMMAAIIIGGAWAIIKLTTLSMI